LFLAAIAVLVIGVAWLSYSVGRRQTTESGIVVLGDGLRAQIWFGLVLNKEWEPTRLPKLPAGTIPCRIFHAGPFMKTVRYTVVDQKALLEEGTGGGHDWNAVTRLDLNPNAEEGVDDGSIVGCIVSDESITGIVLLGPNPKVMTADGRRLREAIVRRLD